MMRAGQFLSGGLCLREVIARTRGWWDQTGRHLIRARDWRDADLGVPSGIMRGLAWDELSGAERQRVMQVWLRMIWQAPSGVTRRVH